MKRKTFLILLLAALVFYAQMKPASSSFSVKSISTSLRFDPRWELPSALDPSLVEEVFGQPFTYLGSGAQCYAFVSADSKYVLKFFKTKRLVPKLFWDKHKKRRDAIFESCSMAFSELKEETALVLMHLNKTKHLGKKISLVDKYGKAHLASLDDLEWFVQKRAQLIYEKEADYQSVLELIALRCKKGIADTDKGVRGNYGFVGDKAVQIDICSFVQDNSLKDSWEKEVERVRAKIEASLRSREQVRDGSAPATL